MLEETNPNHNPLYQYISIIDFVNEFILAQGSDSYLSNEDPYRVLLWARKGLQDLTSSTLKEIKSIELEMFPNGLIYLPFDFVGLVRLSYIDKNGYAHALVKDRRTTFGASYLQDHQYNILLDHNESPLESNRSFSTIPKVGKKLIEFRCKDAEIINEGDYILDKENATIGFLKDFPTELFVVEYFSDGLSDKNEKIHKFAEPALYDYVYWKLISGNRNVPQNEKESARRNFYNSQRLAKEKLNPFDWTELRSIYNK